MNPRDTHACDEYNALSRRGFLSLTGGAALLGLTDTAWLPRIAMARQHRSTMRDVIVSIYLRGGADGLTLCVPHAESAYYTARPTLAVPPPNSPNAFRCYDLDGFFGFPPPMQGLLPAFLDGRLLVVHGCGSTDPSRSHFDSQRFMETGKPRDPDLTTGWLGRHLASVDPVDPLAPLRAVGITAGLQHSLAGAPATLPIPDLDKFGVGGAASSLSAREGVLRDLYLSTGEPLLASALTTLNTIGLLDAINFASYAPAAGAVYPTASFGYGLKTAAALIKAQIGVEAVALDLGGWDTHSAQGVTSGSMFNLMTTLADGLGAFYKDLFYGGGPSVTVVVMSEFGRRLVENGTLGTDHGHGNVMLVMGSCVTGGRVLANWQGLAPAQLFEGKDLAVTIDYRDILAEIVRVRLGNDQVGTVFPDYTPVERGVLSC